MVIDTSVIIAILSGEPEKESLAKTILAASSAKISAGTYLETAIVAKVRGVDDLLDGLLSGLDISTVPMTAEDAQLARDAHARYGRGSGSPAKLNFGDCIAYGLSARLREPLLFKGEDFAHTDVRRVSHLA